MIHRYLATSTMKDPREFFHADILNAEFLEAEFLQKSSFGKNIIILDQAD